MFQAPVVLLEAGIAGRVLKPEQATETLELPVAAAGHQHITVGGLELAIGRHVRV